MGKCSATGACPKTGAWALAGRSRAWIIFKAFYADCGAPRAENDAFQKEGFMEPFVATELRFHFCHDGMSL
ncbi:MAG: hypothetical protein CO065_05125 [Comamonadaceae bacterium CG_4_9_14_0_8_um_filter_57_21]|nr:MAG: hypothetical protein COY49_09980 [Comamonadaceae bacterium CG_4_10_14_0_8_um_filter_57_29]PJC20577.1 MAG: hypothetical protein CO065_05125 [Comamonadaceae bacterium CG_4_9_14_0_8_um_filter_57_21]